MAGALLCYYSPILVTGKLSAFITRNKGCLYGSAAGTLSILN
jgi:hypothetical protein